MKNSQTPREANRGSAELHINYWKVPKSSDGNSNYNDCRLLDSGRWKPYLFGLDLSKRKCIAYHWSFKATSSSELLDKCNIFLRTVYKSSNIKKILVYSSVVVGLGVLGSLISSLIIWLFK